uniref:Putative 4-hydroxybenzoyl-CoA thioesterase n=1 Tax=Haliea sp. ETY-M TaxID=1055105 RepID=A0A455R2X3_9GAMM|nr:putative 4-hydroxybenzoyl-CoA thioesterase [Haliea sp. ETY-M]
MAKPAPPRLADYGWTCPITTRWADNDVYHHVNNVVYYSYFDTVANSYLMERGGLDFRDGSVVGFVVNSNCDYHAPIAFPQRLTGALRVDRLGNSSVTYGIGIFVEGDEAASANGTFTHVFVDRAAGRPVRIPDALRVALEALVTA